MSAQSNYDSVYRALACAPRSTDFVVTRGIERTLAKFPEFSAVWLVQPFDFVTEKYLVYKTKLRPSTMRLLTFCSQILRDAVCLECYDVQRDVCEGIQYPYFMASIRDCIVKGHAVLLGGRIEDET